MKRFTINGVHSLKGNNNILKEAKKEDIVDIEIVNFEPLSVDGINTYYKLREYNNFFNLSLLQGINIRNLSITASLLYNIDVIPELSIKNITFYQSSSIMGATGILVDGGKENYNIDFSQIQSVSAFSPLNFIDIKFIEDIEEHGYLFDYIIDEGITINYKKEMDILILHGYNTFNDVKYPNKVKERLNLPITDNKTAIYNIWKNSPNINKEIMLQYCDWEEVDKDIISEFLIENGSNKFGGIPYTKILNKCENTCNTIHSLKDFIAYINSTNKKNLSIFLNLSGLRKTSLHLYESDTDKEQQIYKLLKEIKLFIENNNSFYVMADKEIIIDSNIFSDFINKIGVEKVNKHAFTISQLHKKEVYHLLDLYEFIT